MSSSSASTSTSAFSTDTKDEPLPTNSEVVASASLLDDTFGGTSNLRFECNNCGSFAAGHSFSIRNSLGFLQAMGEVDRNSNTKLQNVNGEEMLKITKTNVTELDVPRDVQAFEISQPNGIIGTVKVTDDGSLRINHNRAHPQICVLSLKIGDFAIYRPNSMSSPICNITLPCADIYSSETFNGTITFHRETGITIEEQLLCTAAVIAFNVTMKQKNSLDDCVGKACAFGLMVTVIIIVIVCALAISRL